MYFKRSMNRILKVRTLVSSVRFGSLYRCCHSGYVRPFSVSKYDGIQINKTSCALQNLSRNFSSQYLKNNGEETDKPVQKSRTIGIETEISVRKFSNDGIDLMAPNFRNSFLLLKSNTKSRKQIGGKFHTMPKSLTLKLCRQPAKRLSTFHPKNDNAVADDNKKVEMKKEDIHDISAILKSKAEICRNICNPNSSNSSSETSAMTTSPSIAATEKATLSNPTDTSVLKTSIPPTTETLSRTSSIFATEKAALDTPPGISSSETLSIPPTTENVSTTSPIFATQKAALDTPTVPSPLETSLIPPTTETVSTSPISVTKKAVLDTPSGSAPLETSSILPTTENVSTTSSISATEKSTSSTPLETSSILPTTENVSTTSSISATEKSTFSTPTDTSALKTSIPPTELTTSRNQKPAERIIDKLTDDELEEICRTRCPCKDCHTQDHTHKTIYKSTNGLNAIQSPGKSENQSLILQKMRTRKNRINDRSSQMRKMISPNQGQPSKPFGNMPRDMRYRIAMSNNPQHPLRMAPMTTQFNLMKEGNKFTRLPQTSAVHQMRPTPYRASNQLKSKYERMIRTQAKQSKQKFRSTPEGNNHPFPKKSFGHQSRYKQNKPIPFSVRPVYEQNYHPSPDVARLTPRFDSKYVAVPYRSAKQPLSQNRQRSQQVPAVYGNPNRKNKQTVDLQSSLPNWNLNPSKFSGSIVNNRTNTNIGKGMALPISDNALKQKPALPLSENVLKQNLDKTNAQVVDTTIQSKQTISKLTENLSVMIEGPGKLNLVTSSYPELRDEKDVIIQMEYVNLTEADKQHFLTGRYNRYSYATTAAGRTGSGTIIEIGKDVHNFKPGEKVFVKPVSCGKCPLCLSDRKNLCEYAAVSEKSPTEGTLNRLHAHSSEFLTKIPENVSLLNASMTWTLSSAIRACQKAYITAGDVVMVIGGGPLGITTGLAAQSMGATTVCLSDTRKVFLEEAQRLGIDKIFLIDPKSPSQNTAIKIWEHIGDYPRLIFDCKGSQLSNQVAVDATKTGGKVIVMNNNGNEGALPISNIITRDIDIIISTIGNDESELAALRFLSSGKVSIDKIMCSHYNMSNIIEAFQHLQSPNRLDSLAIVKCCSKDSTQENKNK